MVYLEQVDKKRKPALVIYIGDYVLCNQKDLSTKCLSRKLDHRQICPYKITKVGSPLAHGNNFPTSLKHHRVPHVFLLCPADNDPLLGQHKPLPLPVIVDVDREEYHYVEEILDARMFHRKL